MRPAEIARALGRHRSTVTRELRRNTCSDGAYRPATADDFARWRRAHSRRISHESIYRYIWQDKRRGGTPYKLLRQAGKKRRKRYGMIP